jgi:hypothetical protein
MNEATRSLVRKRAEHQCEYCGRKQSDSLLAPLHIEHIVPRKHGGTDIESNLALACIDCNLYKGPNLTGIDPASGEIVPLYNPRAQAWMEHFEWKGIQVVGKTSTGRATVVVLNMNSDDHLARRSS